jgi:Fur family ferric uptake transcriptional regulator
MTSKIERACLEKGLKMTEQRRVIAQVISESTDHPNAEIVYKRASDIDPKISLATVYRTINLFESFGIIGKLEFGEGKARYEIMDEEEHHYHLIDITTGHVIEFYDYEKEIRELKEKIAQKLGYKLVDSKFELYGIPLNQHGEE